MATRIVFCTATSGNCWRRDDIDAVLIATGDRWHATASMLAAEAGKDVYSEKPCGLTIGLCQELADTIKRTERVFQAGTQRRSVPNFQAAVQLAHSGKLGNLHTLLRLGLHRRRSRPVAARTADPGPRRRGLGPLARPRPLASLQRDVRRGPLARILGLRLGCPPARLGGPHGRPLPVGQRRRRHDAGRVRALGEGDHGPLRQRREAGARLPRNPLRRTSGLDHRAGHLPGPVRRRRGLGRDGGQRRHRGPSRLAQGAN